MSGNTEPVEGAPDSTGTTGDDDAGDGVLSDERLEELRSQIRAVDRELVTLIGKRHDLVLEVGRAKEAIGKPVLDPPQEAKVVRRAAEIARELGVDEELTRDVIWRIIAAARDAQEGRTRWGPATPQDGD